MADIYLLSDTHFGHQNMYRFVGLDGVTRVRHQFQNASEGDSFMINAWCKTVRPQDHVYHLGDVAFGSGTYTLEKVRQLPGHKRLVLGNHDDPKHIQTFRDVGFQKIYGMRRLGGLWLTHAPLHPNTLGGKVIGNVHGHIHERASPPGPYVNVSVEQIGYTPIPLDVVLQRLKEMS